MVTSPHTVALHHISDKLTEPLPSSIEQQLKGLVITPFSELTHSLISHSQQI